MTGVFLDRGSLDHGDLDVAALLTTPAQWRLHDNTPPELTAERLDEAEVVVSNKVRLDAAVLEAPPQLKRIAIAAFFFGRPRNLVTPHKG